MPRDIDLAIWPRRAAFEHFRRFDAPFFNVCTRIDVTALKPALAAWSATRAAAQAGAHAGTQRAAGGGTSLALHFAALQVANGLPAWRRRLAGAAHDGVREHDTLHASTTVLRDGGDGAAGGDGGGPGAADASFGFATLHWRPDWPGFAAAGRAALDAARAAHDFLDGAADSVPPGDALIHCTTLPWLHFSSFRHAMPGPPRRRGAAPDCVPKLAFGRIDEDAHGRRWLPLAVDLHHALADGIDAGRFVEGFQALLHAPQHWLRDEVLAAAAPTLAVGGAGRLAGVA